MDLIHDGWQRLIDKYYRKFDMYKMSWKDMNLEEYIVVGGQFGGPLGNYFIKLYIFKFTLLLSPL